MAELIDQNFLLNTPLARDLYQQVAADLPIIDYHSHLQQGEIAERKKFRNITELWLSGDHYKWRLMRSAGVPEHLVTGAESDEAKFHAFCKVLPLAMGNPIYHWCHLELRRLLGVSEVINARNAAKIWEQANAKLSAMDTWTFLEQAKVEIACTTDDPADDLLQHIEIAKSGLRTRVLPAYRPDRAMRANREDFLDYLKLLGGVVGRDIGSFDQLVQALIQRLEFFHSQGARISDHAIDIPLASGPLDARDGQRLFAQRLKGETLTDAELGAYQRVLLEALGRAYARLGWTMCLHIGAQRNNNSRQLRVLGPDTGYDSVSDRGHSDGLAALLDALDTTDELPKTMLFNLNPAMNEVLSTLIGCFQDGNTFGKLQFGPAWWFNDHKEGNLRQLAGLAQHGVLGTSVGMVTDSRSFASYPRHDYFRRLLCRLLGEWVEAGEAPHDFEALAQIVRGVSYDNAKNYFGL